MKTGRVLLILALAVGALALGACTGATATPTSGDGAAGPVAKTEVIAYQPGEPTGDPQEGECWTTSLILPREDAWRCMIENSIYDPCFGEADAEAVVCGADPVAGETGFLLTLSSPLPAPEMGQTPEGQSWMVRLADGTLCGFATGATTGVDDKRLNYWCDVETTEEGAAVGLLGDLVAGEVWTAELATIVMTEDGPTLKESEVVEIATVWR